MSITEDNLKAYLENGWDEDNAAAPAAVTTNQLLLNHCNKLLVRKVKLDPKWLGGVKQLSEIYELRLSHPTKEAGINELVRLLMAYPGTGGLAEGFETIANPFPAGEISTDTAHEGTKAYKLGSNTVIEWEFTTSDTAKVKDYIKLAACIVITTDNGNQAFYMGAQASYFAMFSRNAGSAYWRLHNAADTCAFVSGTWYVFEFKNIDYTARTFDLYIDGVSYGSKAFFTGHTPTGTAKLGVVNSAAGNLTYLHLDSLEVGAGAALNRVPINVNEPQYLGIDGDGNHVHSVLFVATRWE